jgi:hypothetical protein
MHFRLPLLNVILQLEWYIYIYCVYFHRRLMLALLGYVDAEVIVDHFYDRGITYWYSPHATWNLVEMSVGKTRYPQRLYFNLYLKRHPMFFVPDSSDMLDVHSKPLCVFCFKQIVEKELQCYSPLQCS